MIYGRTQAAVPGECEALLFYTAHWRWDVVLYLHFANIWVTSIDGQRRLGSATYDATNASWSMRKYGAGAKKIDEMMNSLLRGGA